MRSPPSDRRDKSGAVASGQRLLARAFPTQVQIVGRRAAIIPAGGELTHLIRIHSGWAMRYELTGLGRRAVLAIYTPGEILGLEGVMSARAGNSVASVTAVRYQTLTIGHVHELMARPDVALGILDLLERDRRRLTSLAAALGRRGAVERVARLLLDLEARFRGAGSMPSRSFPLPLTQQDIADHLGLTAVHVNRVLQRLGKSGIVSLKRRIVVIQDRAALLALADPSPVPGAPPPQPDPLIAD